MSITVRGLAAETAALVAGLALAAVVVLVLPEDPVGARVLDQLPADLAAVAAALIGAAAATAPQPRARLVAAAVAMYVPVPFLLHGSPHPSWLLAASLAALGGVGMLALALRGRPRRRDRAPLVLAGVVTAAVVAVLVARSVVPAAPPPSWLVLAAGMLAWSGAGATSLLVVAAGLQHDRRLPRRVGLAFATLAAAHAIALVTGTAPGSVEGPVGRVLELGATVMLVGTGAAFLASTVHGVRARLAAAEAALGAAAEREEELRAAVAALPGAAASELRHLLDEREGPPGGAAVAPLLRDLAVVHRSSGLAVELDVEPDLRVGMDHWALGQVITNLLVNVEKHAPGARVWLRARRHADLARVEVADDGPGLPDGAAPDVLRDGSHGLAATAEIVGRYGGTFTLTSADGGCVATLELPVQRSAHTTSHS
ncbi:sensor histidine kinase [Pseudonocardia sp. CA-107938]|uniref:sensor histidine kinase n=1 Tax=Pseudonocardia sp. CA-107938 TaxID=3240021 RepID=UPI003D93BA90